jgi:quercetin dioxygenase-like cupin family protein
MTIVVLELEPGAEVPEHSHENEQLGVLIEGSMSFTVGDEHDEVRPGSFWRILANVPHSVVAGPDGAVAVEVFAPVRSEWAALPPAEPGPGRWP